MQKITYLLLALFCSSSFLMAQDNEEKLFDISIHGFVAVDAAHNSRVGNAIRNKHIYLYPLPQELDLETGIDLNSRGNTDIDAAHSRFGIHVKGPTVNGVSVFGLIEADFLGDARSADSNFRLRHAFIRLGYGDFTFLAGQTWHPFFIPENFPNMVHTGVGVPMHPLSRNPQLRLTYHQENFELSASLIEQNNFRTTGFAEGTEFGEMPEITLQLKMWSGDAWGSFSAGYKRLAMPERENMATIGTYVGSFHAQTTFRYRLPTVMVRAGALYGENLSEVAMPGGVARTTASTPENPEFKPLAYGSMWTDMERHSATWSPGVFVGYTEALGASENVDGSSIFGRDPSVTNIFSIAPRLRYHINSVTWVAVEYMYTEAGWGASYTSKGVPSEVTKYANNRVMMSMRYTF
ncbi:DcaP family trimeric outer membrane transporter [Alkalitalea saponilacus]|uniref:Porin subfamily protein n=1 Tax=Alkalitalea saponilacus TaxID=889453 RepID=A0A1T5HSR6_9BACT|nr:DcaP family trimeric outer membrane transporter [Alkalitalea saponilacus]ASB49247.1 hypothetical protein CDL62_08900 [Alkalitalea saponilacus]SKC23733.1 hypothetical protein SAMN03080601_03018 [Alkalitalea saponilacus]